MQTLLPTLRRAERALAAAGVPDPRVDAELLACHLLGIARTQLMTRALDGAPEDFFARYDALVARRAAREPLQRITGCEWFMGLEFTLPEGVLIPRQDTEVLCESALAASRESSAKTALDMCCGSGILAVCLAKLGGLTVTAADLSPAAVCATQENARRHGVCVEVLEGDMFAPLGARRFDIIVCNPPYIPDGQRSALQPEVRLHDPALALFGGADGLDFYRLLARDSQAHLTPRGMLLMEVGAGQAEDVAELFFPARTDIFNDLNGVARVVTARFD